MKETLLFFFLLLALNINANSKNIVSDSCYTYYNKNLHQYFYITATKSAEFLEGADSLYTYINSNVTYKGIKRSDILYGERVIIFLYIDETGKLLDIEPVRRANVKAVFFEKQVISLLKDIPTWGPAECNHRKVPYRKSFIIRFSLRNIECYIQEDVSKEH